MNVEHVVDCKCLCGEAPIWKEEDNKIYWIDTKEEFCSSFDLTTGEVEQIETVGVYQALGMRKGGGWICQTPSNILLLDENFKLEKDLGRLLPEDSKLELNDGCVGPDGCYYVGYYDPDELTNKIGGMFRINTDLSFEEVFAGGYALPNGMAFSPDTKNFYFTAMFDNTIWKFDFNVDSGAFTNKRIYVEVLDEGADVHPDGLIVDSAGYVWSAQWQGGKIMRYTPEGEIDSVISMPVPTPTCMALGADGLLFITTATLGCSDEQLEEFPLSGDCFSCNTGISGVKEYIFNG